MPIFNPTADADTVDGKHAEDLRVYPYYHTGEPLAGLIGARPGSWVDVAANIMFAGFFRVTRALSIDQLIMVCYGAGAAGAEGRLGIYTDNGDHYPSSLLLDAGTVSLSTTGIKTVAIALDLDEGLYWLVYLGNDGTVDLRGQYYQGLWTILDVTYGNIAASGYVVSQTYGPLPATFPAGGTPSRDAALVFARISANR